MTDTSILNGTKKALGISEDNTEFDPEIKMHINSVFSVLQQVAVGPENGFVVDEGNQTWSDYVGDDKRLNMVQTYMYLSVRLLFDPPATSFVIDSFSKKADELLWRLNISADPWPNYNLIAVPVPEEDEDD